MVRSFRWFTDLLLDSKWNTKPAKLMHKIQFDRYQQLFDMGVHENNMVTIGNDRFLRLFDISSGMILHKPTRLIRREDNIRTGKYWPAIRMVRRQN